MSTEPVQLRAVQDVAALVDEVVNRFREDIEDVVAAEVHHIGATAMPFGHTKGDVDVNIRVGATTLPALVNSFRARFAVAQVENWTATLASFSCDSYSLPLGIQVTVIGSADDYLLALHDRIRANPDLARRYDDVKVGAHRAVRRRTGLQKNEFLQKLLPG